MKNVSHFYEHADHDINCNTEKQIWILLPPGLTSSMKVLFVTRYNGNPSLLALCQLGKDFQPLLNVFWPIPVLLDQYITKNRVHLHVQKNIYKSSTNKLNLIYNFESKLYFVHCIDSYYFYFDKMKLYHLFITLPLHFDSVHTATPKKTCFPFSSFLKYSILMLIVIVFSVDLCWPGLVVTASILLTRGAGKSKNLFRFMIKKKPTPPPNKTIVFV